MKHLLAAAAVFAIIGPHFAMAQGRNTDESLEERVASTYIVRFASDLSPQEVVARARGAANRFNGTLSHVYTGPFRGFAIRLSALQASRLSADIGLGAVAITRDRILSLPDNERPRVSGKPSGTPGGGNGEDSTGTGACTETVPWGVKRVTSLTDSDACGKVDSNTYTLSACVIDTGIDFTHPDLNVNKIDSRNFVPRAKSANDDHGHGSHVAGTIAAIGNKFGVIGVAPGAEVVAVKVLDRRGSGAVSDVIAGVNYAAGVCHVANISLGGSTLTNTEGPMEAAIKAAALNGLYFTIAAGNSSKDTNFYSPAKSSRTDDVDGNLDGTTTGTTADRVLTIASINSFNRFSSFSNFQGGGPGADVDYAQPGEGILSTYKDGGYATANGTSMAAPHAAGLMIRYLQDLQGTTTKSDHRVDGCALEAPGQGVYQVLVAPDISNGAGC